LESRKDAFSIELQQYCITQPVCVIRGLAGALKLGVLCCFISAFVFLFFCLVKTLAVTARVALVPLVSSSTYIFIDSV